MGNKFQPEVLPTSVSSFFFDVVRIEYNVVYLLQISLIIILGLLVVIFILLVSKIKAKKELDSANLKILTLTEAISEHNIKHEIADQTILTMRSISIRYFEILKEVPFVKQRTPEHIWGNTDEMLKKVNQIIYNGDIFNWEVFYEAANIVYDNYFEKVKYKFPQLDNKDIMIYSLTYLKMRNNEIEELLGIGGSTVSNRKTEIRKKLGMGNLQNIPKFIDNHLNE